MNEFRHCFFCSKLFDKPKEWSMHVRQDLNEHNIQIGAGVFPCTKCHIVKEWTFSLSSHLFEAHHLGLMDTMNTYTFINCGCFRLTDKTPINLGGGNLEENDRLWKEYYHDSIIYTTFESEIKALELLGILGYYSSSLYVCKDIRID
jgi:hypothetical protein